MKNAPNSGAMYLNAVSATPNKQRRDERPADRSESADRDHDQEISEVLKRIVGPDRQDLGAERAAEPGKTAAERERDCEQPRRVDADGLRHPQIVDSRADLRAEARAFEHEPQRGDHDARRRR